MKMSNEFGIRLGADLDEAIRNGLSLQLGAAITCLNDAERQFAIGDFCRDLYIGILRATDFNTGKDNFCIKQHVRKSKSGYTLTYQVSSSPLQMGAKRREVPLLVGAELDGGQLLQLFEHGHTY